MSTWRKPPTGGYPYDRTERVPPPGPPPKTPASATRAKPPAPPPVHPFDGVYVVLPAEPPPAHQCKPPRTAGIAIGSLWGCHCGQVWRLPMPSPSGLDWLDESAWERVGWRERRRYWRRVRNGERS